MSYSIQILTERFLLRELTTKDINKRYLSWLSDPDVKKFIVYASEKRDLSDLKHYVFERTGIPKIIFLGIFEKKSGLHIGNIKYDPVDKDLGYAIMGRLIGDKAFRGIGVMPEVVIATAEWLKTNQNINQIVAGVNRDNYRAIRSNEKVGFVIKETKFIKKGSDDSLTMVWNL